MKRKLLEKYPPIDPVKTTGKEVTVQAVDEFLILDIWETGINEEKNTVINNLLARHMVNVETGEYETYDLEYPTPKWTKENILSALDLNWYYYMDKEIYIHPGYEKLIYEYIAKEYSHDALDAVARIEYWYNNKRREKSELNREKRIKELMDEVPVVPKGLSKKIIKAADWKYYAIKGEEGITCTACGEIIDVKPKNGEKIKCPLCGEKIIYYARKKKVEEKASFLVIQGTKSGCVARFFKACTLDTAGYKKDVDIIEERRLIIPKNGLKTGSGGNLYIEQRTHPDVVVEGQKNKGWWDNKHNRGCKREPYNYYLMTSGIEYMAGTPAESWIKLFKEFAKENYKLDYLTLLQSNDERFTSLIEMLYKGRFYRLMRQEANNYSLWYGGYSGALNIEGNTIEEIFKINDRQKINRIRDNDGGYYMLKWLQWSDKENIKIKNDTLIWLEKEELSYANVCLMLEVMTLEQIRNYVIRQQAESYKGKTAGEVISQWDDYITMCKKMGKDTSDAMIYRPRELKRRHDEAVAELERMKAKIQAEEYSKKYSEAEEQLREVTQKLEYEGDEYFIKVPEKIIDIVTEGRYLHHCVGSTDRYFDRIKQRETYICFLRKKESPDVPFYTIEVEPGGTVRQHRGMYDEEPEFDKVGPFIKKWQLEIKRRMTKEDKKLAKLSEKARNDNMEELRRQNNTRVIKGLLEDLMEVS